MSQAGAEILDLLQDMETRSQTTAANLPQLEVNQRLWEGLAFQVAGIKVVTPIDEVSEILNYPPAVTRVPGVKSWVCGVANVRGSLLPIVDLQAFLGAKPVVPGRRSRVLVVNRGGITTGLLVGKVFGLRHYSEDTRIGSARIEGVIGPYVQGAFSVEGEIWPVLGMSLLVGDEEFRVAAA